MSGGDSMKKFLAVALILLVMCVAGCGSKYSDETYLDPVADWTETKDYVRDYLDALETDDDDFLMQQFYDGRIKAAPEKLTKIAVMDEYDSGKIVEIKFLEGRYKNKVGYTLAEFIIDAGKERELMEAAVDGIIPIDKLPSQYKQAYDSLFDNGIKIDNPQVKLDGHGNYSLVADTNLPYGTRISAAGVETSTGKSNFTVKLAAPPGKKILIRILNEKDQPRNVISVNAALVKNKGNAYSIFGKEIYIE